MTTTYLGPATFTLNDLTAGGIARIYLTAAGEWEGEFLRGDASVLWKMFGQNVTLTLEPGETATVMVQGFGKDAHGDADVRLVGSGRWPLGDGAGR